LRKLVEFGFTQEAARRCYARIAVFGDAQPLILRINNHGAKFPDPKPFSVLPDPLLAKEDRAPVRQPNQNSDQQKQRTEQREAKRGKKQVVDSLRPRVVHATSNDGG